MTSTEQLANFTVNYGAFGTRADANANGKADEVPLHGTAAFIAQLDRPAQAPTYVPPAGVDLGTVVGCIDSDGLLKDKAGGTVGLRLPANDPILALESLPYRVSFNLFDPTGKHVDWPDTTFLAPVDDSPVELSTAMPVPGAVGVGITRGQDGAPVDDVQLDPNGNLVFYVQGVPIGQPIAIPAGAGGGLVGAAIEYNYSNAIIPAPNGNQFRLNSLDMTAVTEGYFHVTAANGSDVTHVLDMFKAGGRFLLQDHNDSSKYAVFDVTGPPQLGAAFRILLLAWVEGPGSFNNSQKTMMIIAKFSA